MKDGGKGTGDQFDLPAKIKGDIEKIGMETMESTMGTSKCVKYVQNYAISVQCFISYRTQLFDLLYKSNDWFLYKMQHWAEMG